MTNTINAVLLSVLVIAYLFLSENMNKNQKIKIVALIILFAVIAVINSIS